jgi:hypothetical protein
MKKNIINSIDNVMHFFFSKKKVFKKFLRFVIIFFWLFLLYNDNITIDRLFAFLIIIFVIYTYTRFLNWLDNNHGFFFIKLKKWMKI